MKTLITGDHRPEPGDLVLARIDEIGKQAKLELTDGRRAHLFPGDEIVVCYGNRYAPDQYEAKIGPDLAPCDLVAAGGLASIELTRHLRIRPPTQITPLGLIGDAHGHRLNVMQFSLKASDAPPQIPAILSLGTSMNAGKTLTATSMVRGFKRLGFKVAALKITGTGAGGDMWIVSDAGADVSLDFTDAGYASTYLVSIPDILLATNRLMNHAADLGCDIAVIEIADGLQQLETAQLIRHPAILDMAVGTVFAAYDAMGAKYGVDVLREAGHSVLALSGRLGLSPLGVREAEAASGLRVYSPFELQEGMLIPVIRDQASRRIAAHPRHQHFHERLAQAVLPSDIALGNLIPSAETEGARPDALTTALARDLLSRAAEHLMGREADALCGVPYGERRRNRKDWRNGFAATTWTTDLGEIELMVPRLKRNGYAPGFLARPETPRAELRALLSAAPDGFAEAARALLVALGANEASCESLAGLCDALKQLLQPALPQRAALRAMPLPGAERFVGQSDGDPQEEEAEQLAAALAFSRRSEAFFEVDAELYGYGPRGVLPATAAE
ncbi:transposase [Paracoccus aminophilus]|nr:transposase [Paracoccus aminophilus]